MEGDISMETLCENVEFLREDIGDLARVTQNHMENLSKHETESSAKIVDLMNRLRQEIDNKERRLLALNESEFLKCKAELSSRLTESTDLARVADSLSASLEEVNKTGRDADMAHIKQRFDSLQSKYFDIYDRKICPEFVVKLEDQQAWEDLRYGGFEYYPKFLVPEPVTADRSETHEDESPPPYMEISEFDFSCQTKNETTVPFPTALIWVNRKLVITDKANHKVKFFWDFGDFLHEMTFLNSEPYGVCFISRETDSTELYAVTLPKQKKIYFVNQYVRDVPFVQKDVTTAVGYGGIACLGKSGLAVSAVNLDYPRVDIINYQGETLRSMAMDFMKQPLFAYPRFIVADGSVCIVSDWRQNKLTFLGHQECSILGSYTGTQASPLQDPYDVTVDGKGYIFVMDGKTGKVHVIDRNFQSVCIMDITGTLLSPRLLAFDPESGRLAVTYAGGFVKSFPAPSALPNYSQTSGRGIPSAPPFMSESTNLLPPSDSHLRCPSPGF